jgi:hypothetical protein
MYPEGIEVNSPAGWKEVQLTLERDKTYHSLVEHFEGNFMWYGESRRVLKEIEIEKGINADVRLLIEIQYTRGVWELLFDGSIKLAQKEEISKLDKQYKYIAPIVRASVWTRFINRVDTSIPLASTTPVDGGSVTGISSVTIPLPAQIIRQTFERRTGYRADNDGQFIPGASTSTSRALHYIMFTNELNNKDEIEQRFDYGNQISGIDPRTVEKYMFKAKYAGTYRLPTTGNTVATALIVSGGTITLDVKWWIAYPVDGVLVTEQWGATSNATTDQPWYSFFGPGSEKVIELQAGEPIYFYGTVELSSARTISVSFDFVFPVFMGDPLDTYTSFTVIADTTYPDTTTQGYTLQAAARAILRNIVGRNTVLNSAYLSGRAGDSVIMKGKNVRGFSFADKPMFMSFKEFWAGAEPILNLGLGYTKDNFGNDIIEIERKDYFYDPTPSASFSNVGDIILEYDLEKFYKTIEVGYAKWSAESDGGIDDTQTVKRFNTMFKNFGQEFKASSTFIAAALAIEQTRRNRVDNTKDWKLDEDTLIIACKNVPLVGLVPEVGADFAGVGGVIRGETRYNLRHNPAFMYDRWRKFLQGCFQQYPGATLRFSYGEGNFTAIVTPVDGDWEGVSGRSENANKTVTEEYLFFPERVKCSVPMPFNSWKTIIGNRRKAIEINGVSYFIIKAVFTIMEGKADLELMPVLKEE